MSKRTATRTYSMAEAMEILHASRSYVERLGYAGRVRYYKPSRRKLLLNAEDIDALLQVPANAAVLQ